MSITLKRRKNAATSLQYCAESNPHELRTALHVVGSRPATSTLAMLRRNAPARVVRVNGSGPVAVRLMEMGIVPGAAIRVVRRALFGDPIQVCLRGYHLALRNAEAESITVMFDE